MTIAQASEAIRDGSCSPAELVSKCLARIDTLQPQINAFMTVTDATVTDADAIREARFAESDIREGRWRGPLHGIPIGINDFYDTAGVPTTAAYEPFKRRITKTDAVAVQRVGPPLGAQIVGKPQAHGTVLTVAQRYLQATVGAVLHAPT